jgi:hypothetical protein
MSPNLLRQIEELRDRVGALERQRSRRGRCNKAEAARYLGYSREWIRLRERDGTGPKPNADGSYDYDELDRYDRVARLGERPVKEPAEHPQPKITTSATAGRIGSARSRAQQQSPGTRGQAAAE